MNRKSIITCCDHCPHFDNIYYSFEETCLLLKRKMIRRDSDTPFEKCFPIPDDCPLDKTDQDVSGPVADKR